MREVLWADIYAPILGGGERRSELQGSPELLQRKWLIDAEITHASNVRSDPEGIGEMFLIFN